MKWRPSDISRALTARYRAMPPRGHASPLRAVEDPRPVPPVVVPRWIQLVLLPLAILALWELARAAGTVVLIVIFAGVTALMLNPAVKGLQRRGVPRPVAIPVVYLSIVAALVLLGILLASPISTQVSHFKDNIPSIEAQANRDLVNLQNWLDHHGINVHIQKQGHTALQTITQSISKQSGAIVSFSSDLLQKLATISFALVLSLVLSIYFLIYSDSIGDLVRRVMPRGDGTLDDDYPHRVQRAVLGYVRGALLFSVLMGTSAAICLWIFGVLGIFPDGRHYAVFFGAFYGLMELVPYVGPILGALPPVLVALLVHPISAVWVTLLFVVLQQLEGHLVAPQVFRISLRINPILVILALLIGDQLYGIAGALLALPVAAVIRETVVYLRRHLVLEPWSTTAGGAVGLGSGAQAGPAPPADTMDVVPDRCPDCGTAAAPGDAFCRACGCSLEPHVRTPG
ncbi:MAG TPA: AI-2E family transporter [Solirubrobacteraceae bacterium]